MEKSQFDELFDTEVVQKSEFQSSGKSIYYKNETHTVSLIRLGGRMSVLGGVSHLLCCRHSFLRNLDEKIPDKFEAEVFAYPIKVKPSNVKKGFFGVSLNYEPQNLNHDYETFIYADKSDEEVREYLAKILNSLTVVKYWFINQPYSKLASQISTNGTNAWIEKLWIEDYERMTI